MKNIESLIEKAMKHGHAAIKDYNKNRNYYYVHNYYWNGGNKYELSYSKEKIELFHYNTKTLTLILDSITNNYIIDFVYGKSKSDVDSINDVLSYFKNYGFCHYYPSKNLFTCTCGKTGSYWEC